MNIYAGRGHKVIAKNLDWGWDSDIKKANLYLEQDKEYTVAYTDIHSSSTDVYLVEVPDIFFNSVHFEDAVNNSYDTENDGYGIIGYSFDCYDCKSGIALLMKQKVSNTVTTVVKQITLNQ